MKTIELYYDEVFKAKVEYKNTHVIKIIGPEKSKFENLFSSTHTIWSGGEDAEGRFWSGTREIKSGQKDFVDLVIQNIIVQMGYSFPLPELIEE